jgi:uncharacterized membrane protein
VENDRAGRSTPDVLHRNIRAMLAARASLEQHASYHERLADSITRFTGSIPFVYLHALLVGGWLLINSGLIEGVRPFDPFPFVMLAMIASVEAIFLSTFVLISQNRMAAVADRRADLDLQINLLAEHEITRVLMVVDEIAKHIGVPAETPDLESLKQDVSPEGVLEHIERASSKQLGSK